MTKLTKSGYDKITAELENLVRNGRKKAIDRLQKARSMGDLKENSEYHAAREEQGIVEGRIRELEFILANAEIVEKNTSPNTVAIGSVVEIEENGNKERYTIVGEFEADPLNKKLSQSSPIGQALIGRRTNETVEINIPSGKKILTIKKID